MDSSNFSPLYTKNKELVGYIKNQDCSDVIMEYSPVLNDKNEHMGTLKVRKEVFIPQETEDKILKIEKEYKQTGFLNFDGEKDPYKVIKKEFNSNVEERNKDNKKRLLIVYDKDLKKDILKIEMKRDRDQDGSSGNKKDRQRTEFKVFDKSNDSQKAFKNELMMYDWKFKLGNDIKSVNKFFHIMQLKFVGNTSGSPFFTLSLRNNKLCCKLEDDDYVYFTDSENIVDKWVHATIKVTFSNPGSGG